MVKSRLSQLDPATPMATPDEFRKVIHETLKNLRKGNTVANPLQTLRLYRVAQRAPQPTYPSITHQVFARALHMLEEKFEAEAQIVRRHFWDGQSIQAIATALNMAEGTVYNKQSEAITRLAEILYTLEERERHDYQCALAARLQPPSNTNLVGIAERLTQLVDLLCTPDAPWIIALAGLGGIGKTTLADAVARAAIGRDFFDDIGWVTAKQQLFSAHAGLQAPGQTTGQPALSAETLIRTLVSQLLPETTGAGAMTLAQLQTLLCSRLSQRPHLIIIDNLETLTDVATLLATLRDLANPTKFLLTSRVSLFSEPDIYHYPVPELTGALTLHLVRQEARLRNLPDLLTASDADLQPIVETVGGNPLAIRLVVGQTHVHALEVILGNLRAARGQTAEQFYSYIYRQGWDALDETARRVLLVMPLVSSLGGTLEHVSKVSQLDTGAVADALSHLVRLNLVESRGDLKSRRYTIHNLTATFLHEQVIRWGVQG